jgi:hypothetical protein
MDGQMNGQMKASRDGRARALTAVKAGRGAHG